MRVNEIAQRFNVNRVTVWRWVKSGVFPRPMKITYRHATWPMSVIEAWEQERLAAREAQ